MYSRIDVLIFILIIILILLITIKCIYEKAYIKYMISGGKQFNNNMNATFVIDKILLVHRILLRPRKFKNFIDNITKLFPEEIKILSEPNFNFKKYKSDELLKYLENDENFIQIMDETEKYRSKIENEFNLNKKIIFKILNDILKIDITGDYIYYMIHPYANTGNYLRNNEIQFGHTEDFPNYTIIYLMHEYMHSLRKNTVVYHSIINLAIDNELRIRLNKIGKYFEYGGNKELVFINKRIYPYWVKYLNKTIDIFEFASEMEEKFEGKVLLFHGSNISLEIGDYLEPSFDKSLGGKYVFATDFWNLAVPFIGKNFYLDEYEKYKFFIAEIEENAFEKYFKKEGFIYTVDYGALTQMTQIGKEGILGFRNHKFISPNPVRILNKYKVKNALEELKIMDNLKMIDYNTFISYLPNNLKDKLLNREDFDKDEEIQIQKIMMEIL